MWVANDEPGSVMFGLSGCHVELETRAMLCDLSHLFLLTWFMAQLWRESIVDIPPSLAEFYKERHLNWSTRHFPFPFLLDLPLLKTKVGKEWGIGVF